MRRKEQRKRRTLQYPGTVISYPYRPALLLTFLLCAGFGAGAYVVFFEALNNTRGMLLTQTIHLGVQGATRVLWGVFACSLTISLTGGLMLLRDLFFCPLLEMDHTVLRIPSGLRLRQKEIPLAGIDGIEILTSNKKTFLAIWHASGYDHVMESQLPDKAAFAHFVHAISERIPAV